MTFKQLKKKYQNQKLYIEILENSLRFEEKLKEEYQDKVEEYRKLYKFAKKKLEERKLEIDFFEILFDRVKMEITTEDISGRKTIYIVLETGGNTDFLVKFLNQNHEKRGKMQELYNKFIKLLEY